MNLHTWQGSNKTHSFVLNDLSELLGGRNRRLWDNLPATLKPRFKLEVRVSMVCTCKTRTLSDMGQDGRSWCAQHRELYINNIFKYMYTVYSIHVIILMYFWKICFLESQTSRTLKCVGFAANKGTGWINAMLICNDFPKLGTNLVSALALLPCLRCKGSIGTWVGPREFALKISRGPTLPGVQRLKVEKAFHSLTRRDCHYSSASGLPGRARAHAWLIGKLKAKGTNFEDTWGLKIQIWTLNHSLTRLLPPRSAKSEKTAMFDAAQCGHLRHHRNRKSLAEFPFCRHTQQTKTTR